MKHEGAQIVQYNRLIDGVLRGIAQRGRSEVAGELNRREKPRSTIGQYLNLVPESLPMARFLSQVE
jgi:hypothetical protein